MDYIKSFNKEIEQHRKQEPNNSAIKVILRYMKENRYTDYYSAMDSLGLKVGLEFCVENLYNPNYEFIGYIPSIKYLPHNPAKHEAGLFPLRRDEDYFKSATKAYAYVAKEYYYRLMSIHNLEELVFAPTESLQ